ncbi:MAG: uroporphyrinogen-III synthase [Alphaproteobacteria bacterium]|nr:MAG: uroporphyrinogen-III synthase [Alphaproteobacteria bacterium]
MRILVTRPQPDADQLATVLVARGHEVIVEPLMTIDYDAGAKISVEGAQAILITSANGARALAAATPDRGVPLFCVGAVSAAQAAADGFSTISNASGDTNDLAQLVADRCRADGGHLIHIAGSVVAGDLAGQLTALGFTVDREVLYEAKPRDALSDPTKQAIADDLELAVTLFSPRTAKTFIGLIEKAELKGACTSLDLLCLSQAVADAVSGLSCRAVKVADRPTTDAMLALI